MFSFIALRMLPMSLCIKWSPNDIQEDVCIHQTVFMSTFTQHKVKIFLNNKRQQEKRWADSSVSLNGNIWKTKYKVPQTFDWLVEIILKPEPVKEVRYKRWKNTLSLQWLHWCVAIFKTWVLGWVAKISFVVIIIYSQMCFTHTDRY